VRVRVVLAVALVAAVGALVLDMSRAAPRTAGSDHTASVGFVATLEAGQELCQPGMVLPGDTGRIQVLIGTYGAPVPALGTRFLAANGALVARGAIAAGAAQGEVTVPVSYPHGTTVAGSLCLHVGAGAGKTVIGGDVFNPGSDSEQVDGKPQPGRIAVAYVRPGSESWWELLPTLSTRFGLGKASFFGDWALLAAALALLGVWVATVRLLLRELA
jgi:hypothetical protein